jgi:predicted MPP superfamily phosphohydrolase
MPLAVIIRRVFLITLLVLPQCFWLGSGWRLSGGLRRPAWRSIVKVLLVVAAVAMVSVLYDRISRKFLPANVSFWIAPPVQLWIFTSTFTFFAIKIVRAIAWLCSRVARLFSTSSERASSDPSRRTVLRRIASLAAGAPFVAAVYGYAWERLRFEIVRVEVPLSGLPQALEGLKIVQLSDIHVGDFMPLDQVRRAVEIANGLGPHLAVITGDFVTSAGDPLADCIAELGRLKAPLGVWGCNGNHEIYAGAEEQAEQLFASNGMRLLRQSAAQIHWKGEGLNLIGIDYQRDFSLTLSASPSLKRVETLARRDMPNILLSHNPNTFPSAAAAGVELSLAGHTHGGQVNVEILHKSWSPARFMTNFVAGLYQRPMASSECSSSVPQTKRAWLYVNRGLGTLGVPARLGAAPEITLLTLRADRNI